MRPRAEKSVCAAPGTGCAAAVEQWLGDCWVLWASRAQAVAGCGHSWPPPTLTLALGKLEAWEGSIESSVWVTDSVESGSVSQSGGVSTQWVFGQSYLLC